MDKARRQTLVERRKELNKIRYRQELIDSKKELLAHLKAKSIAYKIHIAEDATETTDADLWLANNFSFCWWGRIDWQKVPERSQKFWSSCSDIITNLQQLAIEQQLGDPLIFLTWDGQIVIELKLSALLEAGEILFYGNWDNWIFSPEYGWCIECYHEGELCFGRSPIQNLN
ncbi:MAG: hypothetical protein ACRC2R_07710 [Xenococcaceae cyanobacterium]